MDIASLGVVSTNRLQGSSVAAACPVRRPEPARTKPRQRVAHRRRRQVNFEFFDPHAASVYVAGTFNGWNPHQHQLRDVGNGEWCLQVLLEPGKYEYRFLVDGRWRQDPLANEQAAYAHSGASSVLVVE